MSNNSKFRNLLSKFLCFCCISTIKKIATIGSRARLFTSESTEKDEFMMASSKFRATIDCSGSFAITEVENGIKKDKIRARANFTRTQNILLSLIDDN